MEGVINWGEIQGIRAAPVLLKDTSHQIFLKIRIYSFFKKIKIMGKLKLQLYAWRGDATSLLRYNFLG